MGVTLRTKYYRTFEMGYGTFFFLMTKIGDFTAGKRSEGTEAFLTASACNGKLNYKQCRDLLSDIADMPDIGTLYGYIGQGSKTCLTITSFKETLGAAIKHRCNLTWT